MVHTRQSQRQAKQSLDEKLELSSPSRQLLENLTQQCASNPSPDNTFQYAFCLSKSKNPDELQYAIKILDSLLKEGYNHQMHYVHGFTTTAYLLGNYYEAREQCEPILHSEPDDSGTVELHLVHIEAIVVLEEKRIRNVLLLRVLRLLLLILLLELLVWF